MKKIALFAFNGEPTCFVHVLLNGLEMREKGYDVVLIIEGSATKLIEGLAEPDHDFHEMYSKAKELGMIDCVCRACAFKMGVLDAVEAQGLPICSELHGHPSMANYINEGYTIITF
jgi:hypothetical protein